MADKQCVSLSVIMKEKVYIKTWNIFNVHDIKCYRIPDKNLTNSFKDDKCNSHKLCYEARTTLSKQKVSIQLITYNYAKTFHGSIIYCLIYFSFQKTHCSLSTPTFLCVWFWTADYFNENAVLTIILYHLVMNLLSFWDGFQHVIYTDWVT